MAKTHLYLCCSVLFFFLGCTFHFGIQNVCGLQKNKISKCFPDLSGYTIDLKCRNDSLIHILQETYLNSSSNNTCTPDDDNCSGQTVKINTLSHRTSDFRLQTACNNKSECTETLDSSYFTCLGLPLGRVDYECVPESANYNMCDNLTASSKTKESVFFFASNKFRISDPVLCNCEIRGTNMRVQVVDFSANTTDKGTWFLNITSGFMLNSSSPSNSSVIRLLNNVLEGVHQTVHIMYYSENTSNQNIWIKLTGSTGTKMDLNCSSWIYSRGGYVTGTPETSTLDNSTKITKTSTSYASAFTNTKWTSTVIPSSHIPTTSSVSTTVERSKSAEVTTNVSASYSSGQGVSNENDQQIIIISVIVVAITLVVTTVVVAACIVHRKRRNDSKSVDNVTPKRNNNLYSDTESSPNISEQPDKSNNDYTEIDLDDLQPEVTNDSVLNPRDSLDPSTCSNVYWTVDPHDLDENENTSNGNVREKNKRSNGAVNTCYSKDDVIQSPNRDQTKKSVQVVVIASTPENTPQKSNRPPIKPRKSRAAFSNTEVKNEESGDIFSELGEHPVFQINTNDIQTNVNDKHESSSKCVPEEEMTDNFLYDMDEDDMQCQDSHKCVPEEDMKDNFLYSMDDTEFQDSQKSASEEEMKDNFLYRIDDTDV